MNDDPFLKAIGDNRAVDGENDFDVITEAIYTSKVEAQASMAALFGNIGAQIMNDESKFCEPGSTKFYIGPGAPVIHSMVAGAWNSGFFILIGGSNPVTSGSAI